MVPTGINAPKTLEFNTDCGQDFHLHTFLAKVIINFNEVLVPGSLAY